MEILVFQSWWMARKVKNGKLFIRQKNYDNYFLFSNFKLKGSHSKCFGNRKISNF